MADATAELNGHLDALTPLQRRFVELALDCGSAVEAYRLAGGKASSDESAFTQASRLMRNGQVSAALTAMKYERSRLLVADSAWIREQLVKIVAIATQAIPVYDSQGEPTGTFKCDLAAANSALRTLVALNVADPPPKDDAEAVRARLRAMGVDPDEPHRLPDAEDYALRRRLGIDYNEARTLRKAEELKGRLGGPRQSAESYGRRSRSGGRCRAGCDLAARLPYSFGRSSSSKPTRFDG